MPAFLHWGSQASFISEDKAKALMLPIVKVQTLIAVLGSAKTQKTLGEFVTKNNDAVERKLPVTSKKMNQIQAQSIDVTQ